MDKADTVTLELNGVAIDTAQVTATGYFKFELDETKGLAEGTNTFVVKSDFNGQGETLSFPRQIEYGNIGAWVTVDSLTMGDYAFQRPWLKGRAGYALGEEDYAVIADKKAGKQKREGVLAKKLHSVELSFDNGKTFSKVKANGRGEWRYHIEDWEMEQGMYYLLLRATMENGEVAVTKTLVQINKTAPTIRLVSPNAGGRYNQEMNFTGIVTDDVDVRKAHFVLRQGDLAKYEVPAFLQGMYFDGHFWGGSLWDIGVGLSFFDDNVKLQFQYGQFTAKQWAIFKADPMRYGGNILGGKLLANVYALNFRQIGGADWGWLGLSLALGANFSYFSETQSGSGTMLSAAVAQLEFPKITLPKLRALRNLSLYTEAQLWFLPTDVDTSIVNVSTLKFLISGGLRVYLF